MKKLLLFLTFVGILCISNTFAQLAVGDIAFVGYNTDSGPTAGADHSFSFISLTDIPGNEIIYFTEEGWNDDSNIWAGTTEGHLRWTAPSSGLSCGTVVYITESGVDTFTITGGGSLSLDSGSGWNLLGGDQVLAYQATNAEPATAPSFIAGINGDDGGSNALDPVTLWNDSSVGPLGTAGSGLPAGLSNGINCVALFVTSLTEQDNAKYVGTLTGTSTFLLAEINNRSNWSSNNTTAYDITPTSYSPSVTCVAACVEPDIPTITSAPPTICDGGSALLSISGNLNDATQWSVYTGSCGGTLVATTTSSTVIVTPTPPSTTYYVRGEGGCVTPGSCGSITITTTPIEDASFSYDASAYCVDGSDPTPTITGVSGGSFSSSGGLSINTNTGTIDVSASTPNTYTVQYKSPGFCYGTETVSVTIEALPTVTFTAPSDVCIDAGVQSGLGSGTATGGVYSGSGVTDDGNGMTYSFDPLVAGVGTHTITYTFTNANSCSNSASDAIEVFALPTVTFTAPSDVCIDAGVQSGLGSGTATGGVYSGSGVTDDGNGMTYSFDPLVAGVGTHTITYTFTNANSCSNSASDAIEVFALPTVTFTAPSDVCVDAGIQSGLGSGTATGGVYSGSGVTDDGNGMTYSFDPAVAGVGTHTITYTFTNANGCTNTANDTIEVFALPIVTFTAPSDVCIDAGIQSGLGSGTATGGVYSGSGVTDDGNGMTYSFDPSVSGVGTHTITYTFTNANGCTNTASDTIEVFALPTVTFTAPSDVCIDAGVQSGLGSGTATGGVYSGSGVTDDGNGMTYSFDPAVAGVGTHTITYTFTNANGCTNTANDTIEVFALPIVTFTAPSDVCIDAGIQSGLGSGTATGGVYSGSGVTDDGNGMTYSFDPSVSGVGTHTITYTFTNANGCTNTASDTIEVFALPTVTFTAPSDVCIDAGVQSGLGSGTATGGVYSGPGVTDDSNGMTYSFDPAVAGVGTHTITYTFTNGNGCSNSASDAIEVFALPTVTFTAPSDVCIDAGIQSGLGSGTATGGVYSGSGVTDDGNGMTYSFDPAVAGVGTHTITYTFTNANGCTNTASDDVEVIEVDDTVSQVGVVLTANESGATYQWYECPNTLLTGETNQSYTPSVNGDYKVVITSGSCMVESICVTISSLDIETFESKPKFAMYPNPSNNNVNIKSPIGDTFEIVNLLGQTVKVFKVNANVEKTIYIGNLSDGLYLVKVLGDSNISAKKLIIRK